MTSSSNEHTLAGYYQQYLTRHTEIELYLAYTFDLEDKLTQDLAGRIAQRMAPRRLAKLVSKHLLSEAGSVKPDIIFIIKGMYISSDLLQQFKEMDIRLVNYNPDHPLVFETYVSGNTNIRASLAEYDLVYTYSKEIQKELLEYDSELNVHVLPFGFITSPFCYNDLHQVEVVDRVCFVGSADRERCQTIVHLAENGVPIDVYGRGFERLKARSKYDIRVYQPVFGESYFEVLQKYRVQLNLLRRQNYMSHNMRTFEVPAVGGLQVTPWSEQTGGFFENHKEIFMYRSNEEMLDLIQHLFSLSADQLLVHRHAARERSLRSGYSYEHRTLQLVQDLKDLIPHA